MFYQYTMEFIDDGSKSTMTVPLWASVTVTVFSSSALKVETFYPNNPRNYTFYPKIPIIHLLSTTMATPPSGRSKPTSTKSLSSSTRDNPTLTEPRGIYLESKVAQWNLYNFNGHRQLEHTNIKLHLWITVSFLLALPWNMAEGVVAGVLVKLARLLIDYDGGIHNVVCPIGTSLIKDYA